VGIIGQGLVLKGRGGGGGGGEDEDARGRVWKGVGVFEEWVEEDCYAVVKPAWRYARVEHWRSLIPMHALAGTGFWSQWDQ
jgi:hypothetical protein